MQPGEDKTSPTPLMVNANGEWVKVPPTHEAIIRPVGAVDGWAMLFTISRRLETVEHRLNKLEKFVSEALGTKPLNTPKTITKGK